MNRWLPARRMSAVLWLAWLALNNSFDPAHIVLGGILAFAVPLLLRGLWSAPVDIRRPGVMVRLAFRVLWDIVTANLVVARQILGSESAIKPRFVWFPLALKEPRALGALAGIVTMTPGTLSADITSDRRHLLIHVFHLEDEAALIRAIQTRYEAPLLEIFQAKELQP
jgi:multicomponent K+:H+ antiporter subunit E